MRAGISITVAPEDRVCLESIVQDRNSPQKHVWRARIVFVDGGRHWHERYRPRGQQGQVGGLALAGAVHAGGRRLKTQARIPPLPAETIDRVIAPTNEDPPHEATHWTAAAMVKAAGIDPSVLDALGARPAEAVMIGDAANDIAAARAAGIPVVLRAGGYTRVPAEELDADRIITDFHELPDAIRGVSALDADATCEGAESTGNACHGAPKPRQSGCRAAHRIKGTDASAGPRRDGGSHKHGVSGRPGPRPALKRFLAEFFNEEAKRRTNRRS